MTEEDKIIKYCSKCRQPTMHSCIVCSLLYCGGCEEDHQSRCRSFEVFYSEESGWCLKASRDLLPGELVFSDFPLAVGPKLPPKSGSVPCVGCCRLVPQEKIAYCPDCLWPSCSTNCQHLKDPTTHGLECKILKVQKSEFAKTSLQSFKFEILLPLRVLLAQIDKAHWDNTQNQMVQKEKPHEYLETLLMVVQKKEQESGATLLQNNSLELLPKILAHLKNNCFELDNLQVVYTTLGLLRHSCTPNTFKTVTKPNFNFTVRARTPISMGSPITVALTDLYQGTHQRLSNLKPRNQTCACSRCTDPTEFNTYYSALKCLGTKEEPCGGTQLPSEPTNQDTQWVCDKCGIQLPNDQMVQFVQHLGERVIKVVESNSSVEELEELLAKLLMFLHPNHFYVCKVKLALVGGYEEELSAKAELCRSLIGVYRKLYNGGVVLGELHHQLFGVLLKSGGVEEGSRIVEDMKNDVEGKFDENFWKVVVEDEDKLKELLSRNSC